MEAKQERRGGIETQLGFGNPSSSRAGSRNAVVALKRSHLASQSGRKVEKQERRGGIETAQEKDQPGLCVREAGTPWWH